MPDTEPTSDIAALTVQLLSAYLGNNTVGADDLAGLIRSTRAALTDDTASSAAEPEAPTYEPAVSVRKSLSSEDHIISLIDGKPYKALKRHLTSHGLTPAEYRERYNLPATYPMVAPGFAAQRREIAKKIGLGNRNSVVADTKESASSPKAAPAAAVDLQASEAEVAKAKAAAAPKTNVKQTAARKQRKAPAQEAIIASDSIVDAPSNEPATAPEGVVPKKKASAKSKGSTAPAKVPAAKKSAARKPKAVQEASEVKPSDAPVENPKPAPKRRGKLGLFNREETESKSTVADQTTPTTPDKATDKAEKKTPRAKRMARAPKTPTPATDGGNDV